jgi:putative membrane protein
MRALHDLATQSRSGGILASWQSPVPAPGCEDVATGRLRFGADSCSSRCFRRIRNMKKALAVALVIAAIGCRSTTRYDRQREAMISSSNVATVTSMNAADIAGIMATANQGEIDQAQAALPHLTTQAARDFANMMISDHTAALNEAQTTFASNHIVPRDTNGQVGMMRDQSKQIVAAVNNAASADRIYMQSQVNIHQSLLTMMDTQFIPSAHNDLLNLLQKQRTAVAAHLDRARQILASLP